MDADDGDGGAKALSAQPGSPPRLVVARSLADAAAGELVFVNRRGQVLTGRQIALAKLGSWAVVVTGGVLVGIVYGALVSPLVGVLSGVAVELLTLVRLRHWPAFRTAMAHVAECRWEEAHAELLVLEGKRLPASYRSTVQVVLAAMEALLGQPQQAVDRIESIRSTSTAWPRTSHVLRCQAASVRAGALSTLGRLEEAWRAQDELVRAADAAAGTSGGPRGDYLDMLVQATLLQIAANADKPEALPDADTLHRWARAALGRSRFGEMLVSLAWAFHRRGDDDMARHLLAEAPSRIPRWSLDKTTPALDAWAKTTARLWDSARL
jgi:hypothetical protein